MSDFFKGHIIIKKFDKKRGFEVNNSFANGYLQVTVFGGDGISPIKGALVTVFSGPREDGGAVIATDYTDNSGMTAPIPLEAYNIDYNTPSEGEKDVIRDIVEVSAPGYYNSVRQNIPIFPGIVTREYIYMLPLSEKSGQDTTGIDTSIVGSGSEGSFPGGIDREF